MSNNRQRNFPDQLARKKAVLTNDSEFDQHWMGY